MRYDEDSPVEYVPVQPVSFPATTGNVQLLAGDSLLCGWSLQETTGATAAALTIYDGTDTTGQPLAYVSLSPGQSVNDALPFPGLYCTRAVTVVVTAGSVRGALWVRDV